MPNKENIGFGSNNRRMAPFHARSQTAPSVHTVRARVPLSSENWDDDFLNEGDGVDAFGSVKIPTDIAHQQVHLRSDRVCMREFSEQVEG